jgi:GT2 family glycosyltransferase
MITIEFLKADYISSEQSEFLRFYLDSPQRGRRYRSGDVEIAGWILGRANSVVAVEVRANGRLVDRLPVNQPRLDVAADYSNHPDAPRSGFASRVDLRGTEFDVTLELAAVFANDHSALLGTLLARRRFETPYFTNLIPSRSAAGLSNGQDGGAARQQLASKAITDPICSIVIPVHNHAALTQQCLDSLLVGHGSEPPFEIVVVDDASTDDTPELLVSYGEQIRVVTLTDNQGFARACNAGAETARGISLVFLNNDTVPTPGWLTALVRHADTHPAAGVIGSKLLFPDDTVQHAGVAFGSSGLPHHIYAGFLKDHPAVNISRRFQAVTAACCLVRRQAWDAAGGFDTSFVNGWEDVDFCLRLGAAGQEIRFCHESVVYHLETASRNPHSPNEVHNRELFQQRWRDRVERDSVRYYIEDGLLFVFEGGLYPLVAKGSPALLVTTANNDDAIEHVLEQYAERVATLELLVSTLQEKLAESRQSVVGSPVASPKM